MNEEDKLQFPITFDTCPNCGSTERVADTVMKEEQAAGKIDKGAYTSLFYHQVAITDPRKQALSVPSLASFFDACLDCGTVYCIQVHKQTMVPGMKQAAPKFDPNARN